MSVTTTHDITVLAGNSGTQVNEHSGVQGNELGLVANLIVGGEPFDLTGQEIVFRVMRSGTQVLRKTTSSGITLTNGTEENGSASAVPNRITVPITVVESRTLEAAGGALTYELERRNGSAQRVILKGCVTVQKGSNDD
jgi:hypothetical protein